MDTFQELCEGDLLARASDQREEAKQRDLKPREETMAIG